MLSMPTLALFSAACLALTATPGPDMLLIASRSVSQGRAAGFATLAGIQLGTYCHAIAAAMGLSQLFLAVPLAYDAVRSAGAIYLLYLAWKTLRNKDGFLTPTKQPNNQSLHQIMMQGLLTNLLNPKMALFVLALFPQFLLPAAGSVMLQILLLATVLNTIGLLVNGVVILLASQLTSRLSNNVQRFRVPQYLLGGVLTGLACRLMLASRT